MAKPKIGMTYPTVTGENSPKGASFTRILGDFPEMSVWSVYYDGSDLPSWNEEWFDEAYDNLYYLVSIKSSNMTAIASCMASMPVHLRGRVVVFLHHEPDQWRSASDPRNDPDPTVWKNRQIAFATQRQGSTWQNWVLHGVCFTEDRMRTDWQTWDANWGDTIQVCPSIDLIFADCFNIGRSIIRTGADMFGKPLEFARRENRKLGVREWGQVVPTDTALDNQAVADGVREHYDYACAQNGVDGVFWGMVWYYNHNNVLEDPSGTRPGRPLTQAALQAIVEDAATPEEPPVEPDPNHPQYQFGFEAGEASRDDEVAQLNQIIIDLQAQLPQQLLLGRQQAFSETVTWINTQINP